MERLAELLEDDLDALATRTKRLTAEEPGTAEPVCPVRQTFVAEIGAARSPLAAVASFEGVVAALRGELLLPLRALNDECELTRTMNGAPLPSKELRKVTEELIKAVLGKEGGFPDWRYNSPCGQEQLRGLTPQQIEHWRQPTAMEHRRGLVTHEDGPGELGFFWATKIGGPSHGFDYETQCILPLLCNARHKVILVHEPSWPTHPVGRAHWRFLWSVGRLGGRGPWGGRMGGIGAVLLENIGKNGKKAPSPRLWLETVNADFDAPVTKEGWEPAVLSHAIAKAEEMKVTLSVDTMLGDLLQRLLDTSGATAVEVAERILLRPSHAIVEASDYLSRSGRTGEVDRDSDTMLGGGWVDITYYEHAQYHSVACEVKPTYSFA
ncbi:Uncharacterized protein SCF082_LOCUS35475 [Durusdinium trenchii]|uniref:Uncharacterized protein n=1 Tax=Durusdinium trenchii TaxID=1381693 RepID=A0ABP0P772_9DINO